MTAKENERLAILETHMESVISTLDRIEVQVTGFHAFRGKVVGGVLVGGIAITTITTVLGAILYG